MGQITWGEHIHAPDAVRFFVGSVEEVTRTFELKGQDPSPTTYEHVYFDKAHPFLPFTGHLRARRKVTDPDRLLDPEAGWVVDHRWTHNHETRTLPGTLKLEEVPEAAADALRLYGVSPRFGVRFERRRYVQDPYVFDIDTGVQFYALHRKVFPIRKETSPRVAIRVVRQEDEHFESLSEIIDALSTLPYSTKCMVGYSAAEMAFRHPKYSELPGYEYEAKLAADHLHIDLGELPFPVLEVVQSDSIRKYYKDHRINTRGDDARVIRKGKVEPLEGDVLKRTEVKEIDLDAWAIEKPLMMMRRYKRKVNVFNPATHRVYTISLHHCESDHVPAEADDVLQQVEIEYEGTLVPELVRGMAEFKASGNVSLLLDMARRAHKAGRNNMAIDLAKRAERLAQEKKTRNAARELVGKIKPAKEKKIDPQIEAEVVDDMIFLKRVLTERYGFQPTRVTKRKWLRQAREAGSSQEGAPAQDAR